jgi:glucose-1-phosphate cytidylyltransferase
MKAVILAGGLGTRLAEETAVRPKPMVEIGGRPILWHILKSYSYHGIREFVFCLGYKGYMIKEYFQNYALHMSDVTIDLREKQIHVHRNDSEDWRISLIDTGETSMTGDRIKNILPYVEDDDCFCMTYGDGVSDIDISSLIAFHRDHGKLASVTAVRPPRRFGQLIVDGTRVTAFKEKPDREGGWINGGFFVLSPKVGKYILGPSAAWEGSPIERLAADGELHAFFHEGFWHPMDTLRDKIYLEQLWSSGNAPWKVW